MALVRGVTADLAKRPPIDDETAPLPDVESSFNTFQKWFSAASLPSGDGLGLGPAPFAPEVLVSVAETACRERSDYSTARKALDLYFLREPPQNQVLKDVYFRILSSPCIR